MMTRALVSIAIMGALMLPEGALAAPELSGASPSGIVAGDRDGRRVTKKEYRRAKRKHGKRWVQRRQRAVAVSNQQQLMSWTTAAGEKCRTREWEVLYEHAVLKWDGFAYSMKAKWCWKNGRITQAKFWTRGWTAWWVLWGYDGTIKEANWSGAGHRGAYRQGRFQWCIGGQCLQRLPWHEAEVRTRGRFSHMEGG